MKEKKHKQDEVFSDEISHGFRRFKRVRLVFSVVGHSSVILYGFAGGLTLWVLSLLILWLLGSDYGQLANSFMVHVPYFVVGIFLLLFIATAIGYINLKRRQIKLNHYIHWCDVENEYESELLTAFETTCTGLKLSSFDELIENNAKLRIQQKGVPKSFTILDIKLVYKFAGLITYIVLLILVIGGIHSIINSENSKIASNDETIDRKKTDFTDSDKDKEPEKKDTEKTENEEEKNSDSNNINTPNKNEKKPEDVEKQDKIEGEEDNNDENSASDKSEEKESPEKNEKPESKPENDEKNENNTKDEIDKKSKDNQDKAKFELDPLKTTPEATEGETKTKKEKVYHIDSDNDADGSLIDAEKLISRLKSSENKDKSLPLSTKEKKLIEKYRNMLEKILTSK